jgi:hypothetical protein
MIRGVVFKRQHLRYYNLNLLRLRVFMIRGVVFKRQALKSISICNLSIWLKLKDYKLKLILTPNQRKVFDKMTKEAFKL